MLEYILGETVTFSRPYVDSGGAPYDPPEVILRIVRSGTIVVYGPYFSSTSDINNTIVGSYSKEITFDDFLVPGIYAARWEAEVEGETQYNYDYVLIKEEPPVPNTLLDPPRVYGIIRPSYNYAEMGLGETDVTFLIGHADGLTLNDPYEVRDMQEAINILGGDDQSPLCRGLLEAYNAGSRDLYLVAAAPMSEWVEMDINNPSTRTTGRDEWGGLNFYERYLARLESTVSLLKEWDVPEIIVPLEMPFFHTGGYNWDGMALFGDLIAAQIDLAIAPSLVIMGSRLGAWTTEQLNQAIDEKQYYNQEDIDDFFGLWNTYWNPSRLEEFYTKLPNKYFVLVWGEGVLNVPQLPRNYTASPIASVAGLMAKSPLDRGIMWRNIPNVLFPVGRDLTNDEVKSLSNKHINPVVRTQRAKRRRPFETVLATDNTDALTGSTYWSAVQMRLAVKVANSIQALGRRSIGTIGYALFKHEVEQYLVQLVEAEVIKDYSLNIFRENDRYRTVKVDIGLVPYIGVREIFFTVEIGREGASVGV